jgi:hypothetical protein
MSDYQMILFWKQHQEYLANKKFEEEPGFLIQDIVCQDAYVSEEERWEELCELPSSES